MSTSESDAGAFNATVDTERGQDRQEYLDDIAADAERAVEQAEATIAGLQSSLTARRAEAHRARAEADRGRTKGKDEG